MKIKSITFYLANCALLLLSATSLADGKIAAVMLKYQEMEQGIEPFTVTYTVSSDYLRIDDESDSSGYIIFDKKDNKIYSVSHYDQSILIIPEYPAKEFNPAFALDVDFKELENAPLISGKKVYNYRVKAVSSVNSETCMDIQLVPGLLPDVRKLLKKFYQLMSAQHVTNLVNTPDEYQTPCYLVDQVYNTGDYYDKGLPIQEWHSNGKMRQLINYEASEVEASLFVIPQDYRQYSLN